MSKQQRFYQCPTCGGKVHYPQGKRLSIGVITHTQTIHEASCPGRARRS